MPNIQPITPCLWFDDQAEEAAEFYTLNDADTTKSQRTMTAMLQTKKIDISELLQVSAE